MSYINKKKFIKIKENINNFGFDGEKILKLIETEGYDEFLFSASSIEIEKESESVIIIADFIHLVVEKENEDYKLIIE